MKTINSLRFLLSFFAYQNLHAATCGDGFVGDGVCAEGPNLCCSQWGWCDSLPGHCANYCGHGNVKTGKCPNPNHCCSSHGYCSEAYCDTAAPPTTFPTADPTAAPPVTSPSMGTCGKGTVGNGVCAEDPNLCCSKHGWCDSSPEHCANYCGNGNVNTGICPNPDHCCSADGGCSAQACDGSTQPPAPTNNPGPTSPTNGDDNSRLIAYVGNWNACPTETEWSQYSHIVIAFAVSYQWTPQAIVCNTECEIQVPPVCGNQANQQLIDTWHQAGKSVLLSFGGASMGGSWAGAQSNCWDYCFGKEDKVVHRLTEIVEDMGLDGVDLDYEYFYEDHQGGSNFDKGVEAQLFLREVTTGLRSSLPPGSIVTHAPMEHDLRPGSAYFEVLAEVSWALDFIMPQYYNGYVHPLKDFDEFWDHYQNVAGTLFDGDTSKVVVGFCLSECGNDDATGYEAASIVNQLTQVSGGCHGGAFFWSAVADQNGVWSVPVATELESSKSVCAAVSGNGETKEPTLVPTMSPTGLRHTPIPTVKPTETDVKPPPTQAPVGGGGISGNNCGTNWIDARKCQVTCDNDDDCPSGEYCWAAIDCSP